MPAIFSTISPINACPAVRILMLDSTFDPEEDVLSRPRHHRELHCCIKSVRQHKFFRVVSCKLLLTPFEVLVFRTFPELRLLCSWNRILTASMCTERSLAWHAQTTESASKLPSGVPRSRFDGVRRNVRSRRVISEPLRRKR